MTTLLLFAVILLAGFLLIAVFLWQGARLAGAPRASLLRAVLTLIIVPLGWLAGAVLLINLRPMDTSDLLYIGCYLVPAGMIALLWLWLVSRFVFRASTTQIIYAWLPSLVPCLALWLLFSQLVRPHVLETDLLRSNSMSPTLLAVHHEGTCPHCGGTAFVPYTATAIEGETPWDRLGMCGDCRRLGRIKDTGQELLLADRFVVNKLFSPQRWDLIQYRDPTKTGYRVRFVKRLVGLPGEEIVIREGRVWANGQRLELPDELQGLEFSEKQFDGRPILWGTAEKPARLGTDEYFVLDDFSVRSNDSRMWMFEIDGRPAYALPGSAIEGVVAYRYWPYERFRIFR